MRGDTAIVSSPRAIVDESAFCRLQPAALRRIGKRRLALIIQRLNASSSYALHASRDPTRKQSWAYSERTLLSRRFSLDACRRSSFARVDVIFLFRTGVLITRSRVNSMAELVDRETLINDESRRVRFLQVDEKQMEYY